MENNSEDHEKRLTKLEVSHDYQNEKITMLIKSVDSHIEAEAMWQQKVVQSIDTLRQQITQFKWGIYGIGGTIVVLWSIANFGVKLLQQLGIDKIGG